MRAVRRILLLCLVVVVVGGGYWWLHKGAAARPAATSATALAERASLPVRTATIRTTVDGTGNTAAHDDRELMFGTTGQVKSVAVSEGQTVKEGQVLARLDDTKKRLDLLKAQQALAADKISGSPNAVKTDELNVQTAEDALAGTVLTAPFDGIVSTLDIQPGDYVGESKAVMRLVNPSQYRVDLKIDEADLSKVKPGQDAIVALDAYPGVQLHGHVTKIGYAATDQNGVVLFPVEVQLADADSRLRPGLTADVSIITAQAQNVLVIPVEAIVQDKGKSLVTKITPDGTKQVPIETGLSDGLMVEVKSGLSEGDRIVGNNFALYQSLNGGTPSEVNQRRQGGRGRAMVMPRF